MIGRNSTISENPLRPHLGAMAQVWFRGRLGQVEAAKWALRTLNDGMGGDRSASADVLAAIASQAISEPDLNPKDRIFWIKLAQIARQPARSNSLEHEVYNIRRQEFGTSLPRTVIDLIIEYVTPVLGAEERRYFDPDKAPRTPHETVHWQMEAHGEVGNSTTQTLFRMVQQSTDVGGLEDCFLRVLTVMELCLAETHAIGWFDGIRDIANMTVERVWWKTLEQGTAGHDEDGGERDPDYYDKSFGPITRAGMVALARIYALSPTDGRRVLGKLLGREEFLFQRMYAAALLEFDPDVVLAEAFLRHLPDVIFWNRWRCPEVVELRPRFFDDLSIAGRRAVGGRLVRGITERRFVDAYGDVAFVEDFERARVVDNCAKAPIALRNLVKRRRERDPDFPDRVSMVEERHAISAHEVPPGDPAPYLGLSGSTLLERLENASLLDRFDGERHALAFAAADPQALWLVLKATAEEHRFPSAPWDYFLRSIDHGAKEWWTAERVGDVTATLLGMSGSDMRENYRRISYFLNFIGENFEPTDASCQLWMRLFPFAKANAEEREDGFDSLGESLSSAALNTPLGYLIGIFFRWCPPRAKLGRDFIWPEPMHAALASLEGRPRLILAYHFITRLNYMTFADRPWLETVVLAPMKLDTEESRVLWHIFSNYAPYPSSYLWPDLEGEIIRRIADAALSASHRSRLAEICVLAWDASRREKSSKNRYTMDTAALRNALARSTNAVRASAARRAGHCRQKDETGEAWWDRVAEPFINKIWPLEPSVQSGQSARVFAEWPADAGPRRYVRAIATLLPFMRPFDVWDAVSSFGVQEGAPDIQVEFPEDTLTWIAATIPPGLSRRVFRLRELLDRIVARKPKLASKIEFQRLMQVA